jgi:transposase
MSKQSKVIEVKEGKEVVQKELVNCSASIRPRLKMLLLLIKGVKSNTALGAKVGVNRNCIASWKQRYENGGLLALVAEKRGGNRVGAITKEMHTQLQQRLSDPQGGFTTYKQAQQWINERFGLQMKYKTVNQYLHYHFHTKLKAGRKSHIQKDPLAGQAFKKGVVC